MLPSKQRDDMVRQVLVTRSMCWVNMGYPELALLDADRAFHLWEKEKNRMRAAERDKNRRRQEELRQKRLERKAEAAAAAAAAAAANGEAGNRGMAAAGARDGGAAHKSKKRHKPKRSEKV